MLLVEADPAGGTLAAGVRGGRPSRAWCRWPPRHDGAATRAWCGTTASSYRAGRPCWPGRPPPSTPAARSTMLDPLLGRLGELDADVLVDCGRLDPRLTGLGGCGSGQTGWCWRSGPAWPTCTHLATWLEARLSTVASRAGDGR